MTPDHPELDRLPPHAPEMEAAALSCVLQAPETFNLMQERRTALEWFYDLRHQKVWHALRTLHEGGKAMDELAVYQFLRDNGASEEIGGVAYLSELMQAAPSAASLGYYLDILREKWQLRRLLAKCSETAARIYEFEGDSAKLLDEVTTSFEQLQETQTDRAERTAREVMQEVIVDMEENHYTRGKQQLRGLPTGPPGNYTDKVIRGIRPAHYVVLAGRPGDGKTSYALNIVEYLTTDYVWHEPTGAKDEAGAPVTVERRGIPVAVFSLEMDRQSLGYRLLFARAGVDSAQFNQGYASRDDEKKLVSAGAKIAGTNLYLDDSPGQTIGEIAAKARRMAKQYGIKLFVLDYLQLVEVEDSRGFDRVKELTKVSRKLLALKKSLNVPWLVLAQMNRNIEQSDAKNRVPVLSDLKDCGAIEQDADVVMFLYKPDRRELKAPKQYQDNRSDLDLIDEVYQGEDASVKPRRVNLFVAKNRFGPTGNVQLLFQNNLCQFHDWHQWKVDHNLEAKKTGESERSLGLADDERDENEP